MATGAKPERIAMQLAIASDEREPKRRLRLPSQLRARFRWISQKIIDFGRTKIKRVDLHILPPIKIHMRKRFVQKFPYRVRFAGGGDKIVGFGVLQYPPHRFHIIASEAPIAPSVEVSKK